MIKQAVSALIKCKDQYLLATRSNQLDVFPGFSSLPGGMLKEAESPQAALIRELKEELDLNLTKKEVPTAPMAQMTSPHFQPHKICNLIYLIDVAQVPTQLKLNNELISIQWATPQQILANWQKGELAMVPPLRILFSNLAQESNDRHRPLDYGELTTAYHLHSGPPAVEMISGIEQILVTSPTLPPHTTTNAFIIGDILVDPSPLDTQELEQLTLLLASKKIAKIFLTHTHPDHHHLIEQWGPSWKYPVHLSAYCWQEMQLSLDPEIFQQIEWKKVQDGDVLTTWLGHQVVVQAVPGHHQGQLALYSTLPGQENPAWYLASDLFQSEGTVVIPEKEGDLDLYLESLNKVIQLRPHFLYPSHGMVVGGVERLKKILAHRQERHRDIRQFLALGLDEDQMVERMYALVDKKLWPLARLNIRAHLRSIQKARATPA